MLTFVKKHARSVWLDIEHCRPQPCCDGVALNVMRCVGLAWGHLYIACCVVAAVAQVSVFFVTMPHVYFEANELTHCPWCGCIMVRSIVEMLCVDCSMRFTERLHPRSIWREPITALPVVGTCDKDFGDSVYETSEMCTSHTRATDTGEPGIASDTGGSSDFDIGYRLSMYDKFTDAFKYCQGPFLVEEDLWAELVRSDSLSSCWVAVDGGDRLVQLSLPEFQCLSRYFTVEAPMGFLIVNCTTRTCFHICHLGIVEHCALRSACHYLRNYPRQTIGFMLTQAADDGHEEVSIIQCGRSTNAFCDRYWFYTAQALLDRMLKVIVCSYDHVAFRRGQT